MKFVLSEDEYVEAGLLHTRPSARALAIILAVMAACGFGLGWFADKNVDQGLTTAAVVCVVYPILLFAARRWQAPRKLRSLYRKLRSLYRQHRALGAEMDLEWDERALTITSPHGTGSEPWSHYLAVLEGPAVFVLRITDALYHIIPKSALGGPEGVARFRSTAEQKVVRQHGA